MNKKKILSVITCCILTSGLFSGCLTTNTDKKKVPTITLRLADIQTEGYPTILGDKAFAAALDKSTNGRIKVKVYSNGQLGDEDSTVEQVQFGAIDLIRVSASPLSQFNKQIGVLSLPYLFKDKDQMFRVLDGPIGDKLLSNLAADSKMVGLCWLDAGARNFYNTKKDINTPDDFKGLKIRVQSSKPMIDMVTALGASAIPMATGDVYSALQTGVVDGAENNWPSYLSFNHYEVAKHITIDEHTRIPEMIAMSKTTWDNIMPEDQKLVYAAALEGAAVERAEWLKQEQDAQQKVMAKGGVTVTKLTSNKAFQDKVKSLYDQHPEWKDLIEEIIDTK